MDSPLTHAGGVVLRLRDGRPEYLLVGPSAGGEEWVLPKGHVEEGETPEHAAVREVEEETGVRATPVTRLLDVGYAVGGEVVRARFFLLLHVAQSGAREERRVRWCEGPEALRLLSHPEAREVLATALWLRSPASGGEGPSTTLRDQLTFLNDRMKEISQTANQFLGKFVFGGMVAVIALLNADLVLLRRPLAAESWPLLLAVVVGVLVLSALYFHTVADHYRGHRVSHRKVKYKYELTLHTLLIGASPALYAQMLEEQVDRAPAEHFDDVYPPAVGPAADALRTVHYLLNHHRRSWQRKLSRLGRLDPYLAIPLLLVALTVLIRGLGLVLTVE